MSKVGEMMEKVGDQLPYPEEGWIRFDDRDGNIAYEGSGWVTNYPPETQTWMGTMTHSNSSDARIKFNFIGDRIRIIARTYYDRSDMIQIKINNKIVDVFSEYSTSTLSFVVVYENTSLDFREHFVELSNLSTGRLLLDAIDINDNGLLLPYNDEIIGYKSFIYHNGEYKKYIENSANEELWKTVSLSLPNKETFINEGMDSLSILNRKITSFTIPMAFDGALGEGKVFKSSLELNKYIDIKNLQIK